MRACRFPSLCQPRAFRPPAAAAMEAHDPHAPQTRKEPLGAVTIDAGQSFGGSPRESGSFGRTITVFSLVHSARPGGALRGFLTYFLRVTITGTRPAVRAWE